MSSNWSTGTNTIQEVDTNKNLTCQMFKVRKQGGGTEYLVRKSDVTLGTKSVTQNGTYTAAADGKYGISQFSVNVRGGNGSADSHGKPTGGDIKPGGAGSAVVGTDPETGNDVVVGVDEDDNLVKTPLPSSIVLVTNPTKMDYNDGETIDLSGAVVTAKMADGTTWTDTDHPNGHIALSELIVDPTTADASKASAWWVDPGWSVDSAETYLGFVIDRHFYKSNDGLAAAGFTYNGWVGPRLVSTDPSATVYHYNHSFAEPDYTIEKDGLTFYANSSLHYQNTDNFGSTLHLIDYADDDRYGFNTIMEHVHVSGSGEASQPITLNWARPGDGKVLSTTMEIQVSAASSESEDNDGGGAGHSF